MGDLNPIGLYVDKMLDDIASKQAEKSDYKGEDGLLYCGKCHTPKQGIVDWYDGSKKVVPLACECYKESVKKEKERREREELIKESNIEPKLLKVTFETIKIDENNQRAVKLSRRYAEKFDKLYEENQGLLLYGGVGTGKTVLAHCIANELLYNLYSVASISMAKILKSGFKTPEEEADIMNTVKRVELLIIDDLGAERGTEYAQEFVFGVIDTRINYTKPMIITTNLTLNDMQNCYDTKFKRIYDRILECCYPIELSGPSRRMRNAAERYDKVSEILGGSD